MCESLSNEPGILIQFCHFIARIFTIGAIWRRYSTKPPNDIRPEVLAVEAPAARHFGGM